MPARTDAHAARRRRPPRIACQNVRAFTLTELLVAVSIIACLVALSLAAYGKVVAQQEIVSCVARLRMTGQALLLYAEDYRGNFPGAAPPEGFGDLANWGDLWAQTDIPGGCFFSTDPDADHPEVLEGNKTVFPRVPRMLARYVGGDVTALHCPGRGETQFWFDLGPYYYNTTVPWGSTRLPSDKLANDCGAWIPMFFKPLPDPNLALVACQNPVGVKTRGYAWRHGTRTSRSPEGLNNQWYCDGSIRTVANPQDWWREE
ncbi:MAG: prepilin-type N-terminal cleavage/methylation domain-containing protein [Planctomycetota bacterium]